MQTLSARHLDHETPVSGGVAEADRDQSPRVIVCVDTAGCARKTIPSAKAVAKALGAELTFAHVIEARRSVGGLPFDPVEWDLRRREAQAHVSALADEHADGDIAISASILEGHCAEQICDTLSCRPQDITVICREQDETGPHIDETARRILEHGRSSLLMVPATVGETPRPGIARIIVPLDGSGHSETALPFAQKIAASEDAELVLVHAPPELVFTQAGPAEPTDNELKEQLRRRNRRVAQKYLERMCARIRTSGIRARAVVLGGGDVRRQLTESVAGQSADLLVLASHGHSGFADVPLGDVASFVLSRSTIPVLMIRRKSQKAAIHAFSGTRSKGIRAPSASVQ